MCKNCQKSNRHNDYASQEMCVKIRQKSNRHNDYASQEMCAKIRQKSNRHNDYAFHEMCVKTVKSPIGIMIMPFTKCV